MNIYEQKLELLDEMFADMTAEELEADYLAVRAGSGLKIGANPVRHVHCLFRNEFKNGKRYCYMGRTLTYMDGSMVTNWDAEPISVIRLSNGGVLDEDNYSRIMRGKPLRDDKPWWRFW